MKHGSFVVLCITLLASVSGNVYAQAFPVKPLRILTSPPGGASDRVARLVADSIAGGLGQKVIIDNRPGIIAIEGTANAAPDGYTLLVSSNLVWTMPMLQSVRYDAVRSFAPVSVAARTPNVVVVHPSIPAKSVKELIALARARPGDLNYSAGSIGSTPHLAAELFKVAAGVNLVHVAYKGAGPALTALVAGEVHVSFPGAGSAMPHLKSGRLRALAVTSVQPSQLLPGVPTVAATVPGFESVALYGVFAPSGAPAAAVERISREIAAAVARAEVKERFLRAGLEPVGNSPEDFRGLIKAEMDDLGKVIAKLGVIK